MARVYAKSGDYTKFTGTAFSGTDDQLKAALRRASNEVSKHIRTAVYKADPVTLLPTDATLVEALRDATCAYVAYWEETGDITGGNAIAGPVKILSVTLGGTATGGATSRSAGDTRVSDEAITILRNAGLISTAVAHS